MAEFESLDGVSDSEPNRIKRWISSLVMRRNASLKRRNKLRNSAEKVRLKKKDPHEIHYFHEMDDSYSLLAVQLLEQFTKKYDVELHCHIATKEISDNTQDSVLSNERSRKDGRLVAPHFNLLFPNAKDPVKSEFLQEANELAVELAANQRFSDLAGLSTAVLSNNQDAVKAFQHHPFKIDSSETGRALKKSNELREQLGHYSGAMFYYAGEWYWRIDRLYHLENRLIELGAKKNESEDLVCPRPEIMMGPLRDSGDLKLRFFPSLDSPYTSIIFEKTMELAERTGVELEISPVLPMLIKGVPAAKQKNSYIVSDAAREAEALKISWGKGIYNPEGNPVINCYAIYPWAKRLGKGEELLRQFLRCAFFEGLNTNSNSGMRRVVEKTGLDWTQAKSRLYLGEWRKTIEKNRKDMQKIGFSDTPSYQLSDSEGNTLISAWGHDRLWLISRAIQDYLKKKMNYGESLKLETPCLRTKFRTKSFQTIY